MISSTATARRWWPGALIAVVAVASATLMTATVSSSAPRPTRALDVSATGQGTVTAAGGIDCGEKCVGRYPSGKLVEVTATPSANETFARWAGDCYGEGPTCTVLMDRAARVRAVFVPIPQSVALTVGGAGTVVSTPAGLRCGTAAADCTAIFGQGQTITLNAAPDAGAEFLRWGGACESETNVGCRLTVGSNEQVTRRALATFKAATPAAGPQPLTVVGSDSGPVRSTPAAIDCGPLCSAFFDAGTLVTLSSPSTWSGACVGDAPTCALVVDQPTSVAAAPRFSPPPERGGQVRADREHPEPQDGTSQGSRLDQLSQDERHEAGLRHHVREEP